jgi:hypothetical protein
MAGGGDDRATMRRRILTVIISCLALVAVSLVTDRIVLRLWSRHVFATYYGLKDKRDARFEAAPDHVVVRDDGSTVLIFKPPLLAWSAHLSKQSMERTTYAIEISRDRRKNETRIRMLQELD